MGKSAASAWLPTLMLQLFAGNFFSGFGILCILLVLNFAWTSQLIIFMMVYLQYLILNFALLCKSAEISNVGIYMYPQKIVTLR